MKEYDREVSIKVEPGSDVHEMHQVQSLFKLSWEIQPLHMCALLLIRSESLECANASRHTVYGQQRRGSASELVHSTINQDFSVGQTFFCHLSLPHLCPLCPCPCPDHAHALSHRVC